MTGPRGILFDFNGVLVDDEPQHCAALIATLADHGLLLDETTYYRDYHGYDDRGCFVLAWRHAGRTLTDTLLKLLVKQKSDRYERAIRDSLTLVPGASEFVRAAAADGLALGIVSGALRREIELVLEVADLRRHVGPIIAAEDVATCKPDPEGYRRGLRSLGLRPVDVVVVEDSLPGLAAARSAGLRCAMLTTTHVSALLADADLIWNDFTGRHPAELPWS